MCQQIDQSKYYLASPTKTQHNIIISSQEIIERVNPSEDIMEMNEQGENSSFASRFRDKIKKRKAGVLGKTQASPYINVDYICGSAAEVERLWSLCKYILTNTRSRMTPNLFEALFFLKVNHDYWDASSVQLAYTNTTQGSQSEKIGTMLEIIVKSTQYVLVVVGNTYFLYFM